jgi:hypothetical protein
LTRSELTQRVRLLPFVSCLFVASCGARSPLPLPLVVSSDGDDDARGSGEGSGGTRPEPPEAAGGAGGSPPAEPLPRLCVFDYDLTLSAHRCSDLDASSSEHFCRENTCDTYGWYSRCLARDARAAVAECVVRGAFIGIASHANADACWHDKVLPIVAERQFPELTESPAYGATSGAIRYPRLDVRENWNCEDCAYTMDGAVGKASGIRRVMRHYGLDPALAADRARVTFWDDTPSNVTAVQNEMPEARAVLVPRFTHRGEDGGCGIRREDIERGWSE